LNDPPPAEDNDLIESDVPDEEPIAENMDSTQTAEVKTMILTKLRHGIKKIRYDSQYSFLTLRSVAVIGY
jgi:hypothetical protein